MRNEACDGNIAPPGLSHLSRATRTCAPQIDDVLGAACLPCASAPWARRGMQLLVARIAARIVARIVACIVAPTAVRGSGRGGAAEAVRARIGTNRVEHRLP